MHNLEGIMGEFCSSEWQKSFPSSSFPPHLIFFSLTLAPRLLADDYEI